MALQTISASVRASLEGLYTKTSVPVVFPFPDASLVPELKWIEISENRELPLILHIVRAFPEIIALKKQLSPKQPWIIHGFRGKPQLASELLRHGFYLSIGEKYNPEAVAVIPRDRLLLESDEGTGIPLIENADPTLADKIFLKNLQSGGDGGEEP